VVKEYKMLQGHSLHAGICNRHGHLESTLSSGHKTNSVAAFAHLGESPAELKARISGILPTLLPLFKLTLEAALWDKVINLGDGQKAKIAVSKVNWRGLDVETDELSVGLGNPSTVRYQDMDPLAGQRVTPSH
jgi:hypothetical protein